MQTPKVLAHLQNPFTKDQNDRDLAGIIVRFPELSTATPSQMLALRSYTNVLPEKFFDLIAYRTYLAWLEKCSHSHASALRRYLKSSEFEMDRGFVALREINAMEWHDAKIAEGEDYEIMRFVDRHVHPAYLRLIEGVLTPLTRPVAHFSRLRRNKGTDGLDVWSINTEISGQPEGTLMAQYDNVIRNGIAHGGITFLQNEIRYRDSKGNEVTLGSREMINRFDDLLDVCNGMVAAMKVFLLQPVWSKYPTPRELMVDVLKEQTKAPWWRIEACVDAEIQGRSQLTVYARPDTRDERKVNWSTFQSAVLAENLVPGYDRYFFSLRSRKAWPGWAALDGNRLKALRESNASTIADYAGVFEQGGFFYVPQPKLPGFINTIDTFVTGYRLKWRSTIEELNDIFGNIKIICRSASIHRNSWGAVVRGEIVIDEIEDGQLIEMIRKNRIRIIKIAKRHARIQNGLNVASYLPIGFARVAVFKRDFRQRRLAGFGLGSDLVCTVGVRRISRIQAPEIVGSKVEDFGRYRIAWNRAWLDATDQTIP